MKYLTSALLSFFIVVIPTANIATNTASKTDVKVTSHAPPTKDGNIVSFVSSDKFITIVGFLLTSTVISGIGGLLKSQLKGEMTEYVRVLFDREESVLSSKIEDKFDKYSESLQVITNMLETMSKERHDHIKESEKIHYLLAELQLKQTFNKEYTELMFSVYEKTIDDIVSGYMMDKFTLNADSKIKKNVKQEMLEKYKEYYPTVDVSSLFSS